MRKPARVPEAATRDPATLVHVDPGTLVVGANVRLEARLSKGYVQSIAERGVLEPIVAYRDEAGALVVLRGQRRTLAAVRAGLPAVPVVVVARPEEPDRLIDQVIENDHREALTVGERVAAFEQLAAFGVSAAQIARRTATSRRAVDNALTVAGSKLARAATGRWQWLTVEQAAVVAEFEDDEQAVKGLVLAAQRGGFEHQAQRLRDARAEAAARAEAVEALAAAGVTVAERPAWDDKRVKRLADLTHDGKPLAEADHAECPGHAAYLDPEWIRPDESSDEREPGEDDPDGDSANRPASYQVWVPVYVCTDFAANGHTLRGCDGSGQGGAAAVVMTDADRVEARARRREVIQCNKDWASAETVRRQWLRTFLSRKSAPSTAAGFVAGSLARADHAITRALTAGNRLAHDLLGLSDQAPAVGRHNPEMTDLVAKANDRRAQMIALGLVLASYEEATHRDCWRAVDDSVTRYLRYLEANGYELSAVELRACGQVPQSAAGSTRVGSSVPTP